MEETKSSTDFRRQTSKDRAKQIKILQKKKSSKNPVEDLEDEKIELTPEDWEEIEGQIQENQPFIEKSLQEIPVNVRGVYLSVIVSFLFIVLAVLINRVEDVAHVGQMVQNMYEKTPWDYNSGAVFSNIEKISEISEYIRRVALPVSYGDLGDYNYMAGMRLTLMQSKLGEQPVDEYLGAGRYIRLNPEIVPGESNPNQASGRLGVWKSTTGFGNEKGYVIYFYANLTLEEALAYWRMAEPQFLNELEFGSIVIEYLFQNPGFEVTLYYHQLFSHKGAGYMEMKSDLVGSFLEKFEKWEGDSFVILVIFIIYSLGFSLQIFKLAQNLMRTFKTLFVKQKLDLVWHEYIEIFSVVLALTSLIMFIIYVYAEIGKHKLPIESESDFTGIANYCQNFRRFIQITAVAALLISFKVIVVLRYKFPSFGTLFDTILGAKNDIINFIIITIFLLVGFVFMSNLAFGYSVFEFSTATDAFSQLFDMSLGSLGVKDIMQLINPRLTIIFILVYVTVFYLVLTNMFLAIVMRTYDDLRTKGQLILEAKAEMIAEQSEEWFQALVNLILFRVKSVETDAIEYEALQNIIKEEMNDDEKAEIDEKIKMHETLIVASTKVDLIKIFKTNFGKLTTLNSPTLLTHKQTMEKIYSTLKKILEREKLKKLTKAKKQREVVYNFHLVVQMMIFFVFIGVYVTMIMLRLRIADSYGVQQLVYQSFSQTTFGQNLILSDIATQAEVFQYLNEVFIPIISSDKLYDHNYFISENRARITIQQYKLTENKSKFSMNVKPLFLESGKYSLNDLPLRGNSTNMLYYYYPPGTTKSFESSGGYVLDLNIKEDMHIIVDALQLDNILGSTGYYVALEFVVYNSNLNLFAYSYIKFTHRLSGEIVTDLYSNPIELDYFNDSVPIRGILEICYLLFTIYYIITESREWHGFWKQVRLEERERQMGSEALARVLLKLVGSRNDIKGCGTIMDKVFGKIKGVFVLIFKIILNFLVTTKRYFQWDFFNVVDASSIIIALLILNQMFKLSTNNFLKNFTVETSAEYNVLGEFGVIHKDLETYRVLTAFNSLIIFVSLLQYYKFSRKLSMLTDILDSAKLDLVFFMMMFGIILFAYTLMSYLLLGHILNYYSSLPKALISSYLLLLGEYAASEITTADKIFGTLFYVSLIIVFSLIVLNMFIAIVSSHFEKVSEDDEGEDMGFFAKIFSVIKAKREGLRFLDEPDKEEKDGLDKNSNPDIHKPSHEEDENMYRIEQAVPNAAHVSYWMKVVEHLLMERSEKKVNLFRMKMVAASMERNKRIILQAKLVDICYVNEQLWKDSDMADKLQMWRSMALLSREYALRSIEKALVESSEVPERAKLDDYMKNLWNCNTLFEKMQMWMGENHFDHSERVAVWNSMAFNKETFNVPEAWGSLQNYWESLTIRQKLDSVSIIIDKNLNTIKALKRSKDKLSTIMELSEKIEDFKLVLWLALSQNESWLKNLYLNQPNVFEADLIALLNLAMNQKNIFALDSMDYGLEEILDGAIYDWVEAKANFMTEVHKFANLLNQIESCENDIKALQDYKDYVVLEITKFKKSKEELALEYAKYKK